MNPQPSGGSPLDLATQLAGQLLDGRYQVERLLGSGGMAAVYLARHVHLGRPAALKVLLQGRVAQPEAAARFEREAALAARIDHPNVCRVYDFGWTSDGMPWLAMEYLEGRTLAAALEPGPLPAEAVSRIASDCAAGLGAAHRAGVVHRDLKPANVMLVDRSGVERAVVMDFGIAWSAEGRELTRDGMMVGTPEMMSPEQIAGDPVDHRSDQYQLALLVCRMLTGALPFRGATTRETMVLRLTSLPTRLGDLRAGLPVSGALQAAVDRGLARQPGDRYPGIEELAAAIASALAAPNEAPTELLGRTPGMGSGSASGEPVAPGRGGVRALRPLLALAGIGIVAYLAIGRPWDGGSGPAGDSPPPTPTPAPAPPPEVAPPPPPPPSAVPVPVLPTVEAASSPDSAIRLQARLQAQAVYRSTLVPDSVRAMAAYLVASGFLLDSLPATAKQWLAQCLALGERAMCRRLLETLP